MYNFKSCKDCAKRYIGCHSNCKEYFEELEKSRDIKKKEISDNRYAPYRGAKSWSHHSNVLKNKCHKK